MRNTDGTILFDSRPRIISFASVVGKKEAQGPLRECFDRIIYDSYVGRDTFEQGESELMKTAMTIALGKADLAPTDIGAAFCGDLLNQCVASSFAVSGQPIPYAGIYGACSTMALGLILAAIAVESGAARRAMCAASSHYCTAERQYRFPLEYGSQRPPTAQWTVTGSGACILEQDSEHHRSDRKTASGYPDAHRRRADKQSTEPAPERIIPNVDMPYIRAARLGVITDMGITDQNNMGAAMAPAAADTIYRYLSSTNTDVYDYDAVFTGDLGRVGSRLLYDLMREKGVDIAVRHKDCGVMIFGEEQDVHAGGSGCGCCASVLCGHILREICSRRLRNILFIATGALLSPTTVMQKQTIPSVAHLVNIRI
jgi:stage V sporulation protein AD